MKMKRNVLISTIAIALIMMAYGGSAFATAKNIDIYENIKQEIMMNVSDAYGENYAIEDVSWEITPTINTVNNKVSLNVSVTTNIGDAESLENGKALAEAETELALQSNSSRTLALAASAYDRLGARDYALNRFYDHANEYTNNCANFVSYCLNLGGGLPQSSNVWSPDTLRHCKEITCASCLSFSRRAALQSLAEPTGSPTFCALPGEKNPAQLPQVI